jgi:hypothetical protein
MDVIKNLYDRQVLSIEVSKDGESIEFMEACDHYYHESYTRNQLAQLIAQLTTIHDNMKQTSNNL